MFPEESPPAGAEAIRRAGFGTVAPSVDAFAVRFAASRYEALAQARATR
jgi:hypothetical protein